MKKLTTGLASASLAALALGAITPGVAAASPAPSPSPTADAGRSAGPAAPIVSRIEKHGADRIALLGVAPWAEQVRMQFDGGGSVEPVTDGRYTFLIDKTHLGKTATLTSFAGGIEGESIDVALTLDEDAAPGIIPVMPRVLGVSKDSQGVFVIEGTVTYDPLQFDQLEVTASTGGMPIRSVPDVNGTFTLTIPAEFAGRQIGVQAHLGNKSSAVDTIDLLETRPNTASDTHPLAILSPWAGAELAEPAVTFSGVAIPNSQIVVTNDAETDQRFATLCETNVLANGKWTCDSPRLPDGEYSATVTEKPTWSSVTEQTEGSSFSIVHGDWKPAAPALPHLSSITDSGDHLIVRVVIPGASRASLEVGEHRDEQQGINGRFSFWVEKSLAGQTATVAGLVDQSVGKALDIPLTPIADTITPAPLTAPVIHHVADEGGHVYLEGTTGYAPFEFFTPGVIAKKDGKLIGSTELTYNGAFILRLDEEYVGDEIELFSTRNLELSTATELVVAETEKNSAPETFPLEVTSPADGATVPATSPTFTGEGIPGAKVRVEDTTAADKAPVLVCGADVLADGTWSCEAEKPLAHGEHTTTVTEAPFWVSAGTPTTTRGFTIGDADSDDEAPIVVTTPADGSTFLAGSDVTFTGTATPGADIALHLGYGLAPVIGTADAEGDWSVSRWLGNAPYTATVIQSKNGKQLSGAHTGPTITPAS